MRVEEVVDRVWPGAHPEVEPLGGGITNHNFKVTLDGDAFVLRIGGKDTELLGIERRVEEAASRTAAELGIGPQVVRFLEPEGYLVTRFVEGRPIPPEEMRVPARLRQAAGTLARFHGARPIPGRFDSFRVVEAYRETAARHGVSIPAAYDWAKEQADRIERERAAAQVVPCHNDLLNANFILEGDRLWLVDWEYAGMGDRFFDLANFSVNHELGEDENQALLEAYFGAVRAEDARALRLMRFMSDFREAMWGVVQQGISELDFDFRAYAGEHFERLRRTAAEPAFHAALAG
ncbi:MAG TPA: choline/ethanolamine kinase family protein [Gaiellaceae bacterium]|jgi:thiamine kinase-like enzyme|nr:choline/ethanolamine kinase family protein [Gaiellaceae bacterium]